MKPLSRRALLAQDGMNALGPPRGLSVKKRLPVSDVRAHTQMDTQVSLASESIVSATDADPAQAEHDADRLRLANIIDGALAGTWELNVCNGELRVNPRWKELIGRTPAELKSLTVATWEAHTHPDDWQRLKAAFAAQIDGHTAYVDCEIRMRHASGDWVWVRCRGGVATQTEQMSFCWMCGTLFDISMPKELERRLRESEAFLDRTGRVAGVGGWELDLETSAITWSDQTCRMYDVPLGHRPDIEEVLSRFPGGRAGTVGLAMLKGIEFGTGWDLETPFMTTSRGTMWVRSVGTVEMYEGKARWLVGALQDVTVRRKAVDALQLSERRFRNLFDRSLGLICTHDMEGIILSVNPATARELGYPATRMLGRPMTEFIDEAYHGAYQAYLKRIAANRIDQGYLHIRAADGATHVWQYENMLDEEGDEPFVLGHAQDVTESQRLARQLRDWSVRDPLTRCFNRRYLSEISESLRDDDVWGCIVFDLDRFKRVNDTEGHERGDEVLVAMARFLGKHVRPDDVVVRLGGDEFLVLLRGSDAAATRQIRDRMEEHAAEAPIQFTMGDAVRDNSDSLDSAIKRADLRLYEARALRSQTGPTPIHP